MNPKKRVLFIHRFFYPDSPPYALILEDMRKMLKREGFEVDVLSSQPSYKSIDLKRGLSVKNRLEDGSTIWRLPVMRSSYKSFNKLFNFFWFPLIVFVFLLFSKRYDTITVSTNPPVLLAFFASIVSNVKKAKLIYHCMDIYPEIGKLSGDFSNRFIYKTFLWMDNFTCSVAHKIIVLSDDMKRSLMTRNRKIEEKIAIVNNYDLNDGEKISQDFFDDKSIKRVVFAGNIGRFQNLDRFIIAIKNNSCPDKFELIFLGEGNDVAKLKDMAKELKCIRFIPHQSIAQARKIIDEADMGIVSLQRGIINYAYPSKTMTYLSEGTPVMALVEPDSSLAKFIEKNNVGRVISLDNNEDIFKNIDELSRGKFNFDSKHIAEVFNRNFSKNTYEEKFLSIIMKSVKGEQ